MGFLSICTSVRPTRQHSDNWTYHFYHFVCAPILLLLNYLPRSTVASSSRFSFV